VAPDLRHAARGALVTLLVLATVTALSTPATAQQGFPASCVVEFVFDGDSFRCEGGPSVSLLQADAPELSECGGRWAKAALESIFLPPGTRVRLEYDADRGDRYGRVLAAPVVTGAAGVEYNLSIVMVYVGLARASGSGPNTRYLDWARAAEAWARNAAWNMWAPGMPFSGGGACTTG